MRGGGHGTADQGGSGHAGRCGGRLRRAWNVENQYRDICKLLLEVDPDLISTETDSGESAKELAQKATFAKWIEQEINYA